MQILRTPDSCFANLPDFAYTPRYLDLPGSDGLRMAWIEEGPADGPIALLLHGEPTWGYLYRKMIPVLVARGIRVIVPDLIGFGRSDKPAGMGDYSYAKHVQWLTAFVHARKMTNISLFCQDWGSLLGLRLVAENPQLFARTMVSNGFLPTGDRGANRAFLLWQAFARFSPFFPIGRIVNSGCVQKLSDAEIAAYDAPYPSDRFKAGARAFPRLVPIRKDDPASEANRRAWAFFEQSTLPFLCVFGRNDPILGRADKPLIEAFAGCKEQAHERIWGGHFIQEDRGAYLAGRLADFIRGEHTMRHEEEKRDEIVAGKVVEGT